MIARSIALAVALLVPLFLNAASAAEHSIPENCLGGICLGEDAGKLEGVPWLRLEDLPKISAEQKRAFIQFDEIRDYVSDSNLRSYRRALVEFRINGRNNSSIAYERGEMLARIQNAKLSKTALSQISVDSLKDAIDVGAEALAALRQPEVIFCGQFRFAAYYFSTSGHPTTVVFITSSDEAGKSKLIVSFVGRRFEIEEDPSHKFELELKSRYPFLVKADELKVKCGPFATCEEEYAGKSRDPTLYTAAQRAFLEGRDFIAWFSPPVLGYADFRLQLFASQAGIFQNLRPNFRVRQRLPADSNIQAVSCRGKPKPLPKID